MQFERADLGQRRRQLHGDLAPRGRRAPERSTVANGGSGCSVALGQIDQLACRGTAGQRAGRRRDEVEAHRLANAQREAAAFERHLLAFFAAARQHADAARAAGAPSSSRK